MLHVIFGRSDLIAFRVKLLALLISGLFQILPITIVWNRLVGKLAQYPAHSVPLVASQNAEAVDILLNEFDDIAATRTVTMEKSLVVLVLGVTDDNGIRFSTSAVGKNHFNELAYSSRSFQSIAKRIGNVIHPNLLFEFVEIELNHLILKTNLPLNYYPIFIDCSRL